MAKDEDTITKTFTGYVQAFQTLDPKATVTYFHVPCMLIAPQAVVAMTSPPDVEALLARVLEGLKGRGYHHSELTDLDVSQVSENTAFVNVSRVRYKADGQELERFGETYTFRKTNDGWKIVVATIHDQDTV